MPEASPIERPTPSELKRQLEAERRHEAFVAYRDEERELLLYPLTQERPHTIGRGQEADIRLAWDPQVSSLHAELRKLGGEWLVVDDGLSRNGTFVEGERVAGRRRLRDREVIRCGASQILFRRPAAGEERRETALPASAPPPLTPTQRRVLVALCRPLAGGTGVAVPATNGEIAEELCLSVDAVKAHLRALFERFEVTELPQNRKRAALADRALSSGVVSPRELEP